MATRPAHARLRVGVMLDSRRVTAWQLRILEEIQASSFAELSLFIVNQAASRAPLRERLREHRNHLLYLGYLRLDAKVFKRLLHEPDAFEPRTLPPALDDVPVLAVEPLRKKLVDRFAPEDLERVRAADLDVILRFGFRILKGDILTAARHGIWSYHHGDNRKYRGGPPQFWEMYEENASTGAILQVLNEKLDAGKVLYRGVYRSHPLSLFINRNRTYWKASEFALRRLSELHERGWPALESLETYREAHGEPAPLYRSPTNAQMTRFLGRLAVRTVKAAAERFLHEEEWFVAARRRRPGEAWLASTGDFQLLRPPAGEFYADPFLCRDRVFFEHFDRAAGRGRISTAEVRADGSFGPVQTALERPYHLSYPFVFERGGEVYMIPESRERRAIELYRAVDYPLRWELDSVLLDDNDGVDATLVERHGKLWLFVATRPRGAATCDELTIYWSDELRGPWRPIAQSPSVSDVGASRPAGRIFELDGQLVRPAQDGSVRYGHRIVFFRIDRLDTDGFAQSPVRSLDASWIAGNQGTHTYDRSDEVEVIDGRFLRRRLPGFRA